MTSDAERWAEALAIERLYGADASAHIASRIEALATSGDVRGVDRWREIAERYDQLRDQRIAN